MQKKFLNYILSTNFLAQPHRQIFLYYNHYNFKPVSRTELSKEEKEDRGISPPREQPTGIRMTKHETRTQFPLRFDH